MAGSLGLLLVMAIGQPARAADAERGAVIFRRCAVCHVIEERQNRIGPHLVGIVGRAAGAVPSFNYSDALAQSGVVWTEANLDRFLTNPQAFIPGTRMAFPGLDDPDDRADVIAFLGAVGDPPLPDPVPDPVAVVAADAVAPLLEQVAVRFGAAAERLEPVVSRTTEDEAIAAFCADVGEDDPDLLGITRRIRQAELDGCAVNGVTAVTEIKLGYEALVLATGRDQPGRDIDLGELWLAFAAVAPSAQGVVPSRFERWPEIDPEQPEGALPTVIGLSDPRQLTALRELGLSRGCLAFPAVEALTPAQRDTFCTGLRRLQRVDLPESEIPTALETGTIDLALMTFPGFGAGRAALRPFRINGVNPAFATIRGGSYPLAQPLYLYVKHARVGRQLGLEAFLRTLTTEAAIAGSGDLGALGLVPLPRRERVAARQAARTLPALALGGPNLLPIAPIAQPNPVWSWASAAEMVLRSAGLPALGEPGTYRCNVVAARFGSCQADCATCLNPVVTVRSLIRALDAYQEQALAQGLVAVQVIDPDTAARLGAAALRRMIRNQRSPILAQLVPQGRRSFYPAGMTSHFGLIIGVAGSGRQVRLTVNDPYPYPEALNPYLDAGERTGEPGQYTIPYAAFRQRLGYRQSVVLR